MEIGKIYKLDNELIRLEKIHKNGIHVFKVVDQFGNDVVKRKGNVIKDLRNDLSKFNILNIGDLLQAFRYRKYYFNYEKN